MVRWKGIASAASIPISIAMSLLRYRMMRSSCALCWAIGVGRTSCIQTIAVARNFVVACSGRILSSSCRLTAALSDLVHTCFSSCLHGGSKLECLYETPVSSVYGASLSW
eukprot:5479647-Prymnesium_polylepis.1